MKKYLLLTMVLMSFRIVFPQSVAVNEDGTDPDPSAILDIKSNNKGLLVPRMTSIERGAIVSPATGLIIFDTDLDRFFFQGSSGWIEVTAGSSTNFWSLNGTHIFKNNGGYVGIGISSPLANLDVARGTSTYGTALFRGTTHISHFNYSTNEDTYIRGGKDGSLVFINDAMQVTRSGSAFLSGSASLLEITNNGQTSGRIEGVLKNLEINAYRPNNQATVPGTLLLQVPFSSQFIDYYAGNVGVGVTSAAFKLDVGGRMRVRSEATGGVTAGIWFNNYDNTQYTGFIGEVGTGAPNHLGIYGGNSGWSFVMNTVTGNVGIGIFNPSQKLAVNGTIRSKEVIVESIGWPDYVFSKNYSLRTLEELEKFIQKNKHLPDIPSAKEVEEKGLSLGVMQRKMMEKIEELTLYIIELKREIEQLKQTK